MASFEALFEANALQASQTTAGRPEGVEDADVARSSQPSRMSSTAGFMPLHNSFNDRNPFSSSTMARQASQSGLLSSSPGVKQALSKLCSAVARPETLRHKRLGYAQVQIQTWLALQC